MGGRGRGLQTARRRVGRREGAEEGSESLSMILFTRFTLLCCCRSLSLSVCRTQRAGNPTGNQVYSVIRITLVYRETEMIFKTKFSNVSNC